MSGSSRFKVFILMVAMLPLSGCLFSSSRSVQTRISTNKLQTATLEQLVDQNQLRRGQTPHHQCHGDH